uniref:Myb/SANT-like domain-containing protein n=1 Tax=Lactuca sativa TaxID=4236 RepID=A0A9R1UTR2_LACSA|nr:hypothetical protein LSAT_V11C800390720 [Lactuca sativa]
MRNPNGNRYLLARRIHGVRSKLGFRADWLFPNNVCKLQTPMFSFTFVFSLKGKVVTFWNEVMTTTTWFFITVCKLLQIYMGDKPHIKNISSNVDRQAILHKYAYKSDTTCVSHLRMTRRCFTKLCGMLHTLSGLRTSRQMDIDEQVAIFLHIIAHNVKNRVMIGRFQRSGETISKIVTRVCNAMIRLHLYLLKKLEPVTENSTNQRWKWFKNCLGALDGTSIKCLVPLKDKPKYRTRKNDIATNVLGVCSQDMQFIYVLPGWEGSAADGRVLRDALLRPHGLKVPRPGYYLVGVMEKSRNYHNWTITEDAKLVEALVNMVNMGGFKADNGFKSGYSQHLENALNSGILGKPHIESRIKTMKKDWQVVYDMVNGTNTSGFGYDTSTHSVTAEPAVWDSYIQDHKEAGKWRNKIFPHYEDLCIIFGNDRAQGNKAKDFAQMEEDANNEEQSEQIEMVLKNKPQKMKNLQT